MVTRAELRNLFADAVEDTGKGFKVFNGRHIDALHDNLPAAIIGFDSVDVEQNLADNFRFTGELSISIIVDGNDDVLDTFIDPTIAAVMARMRMQLPTLGCQLTGITYNRELDPGVSAAIISWVVAFNG